MPTAPFTAYLYPILLLLASNVFMTFAWYGHLKYKSTPLMIAILVSWGIAFFEYCLQVPGNRLGSAVYSAPQLKGMQEVITLLVFAGFSTFYLGQSLKWNHWAAFGLILVAAFLTFKEYTCLARRSALARESRYRQCPSRASALLRHRHV